MNTETEITYESLLEELEVVYERIEAARAAFAAGSMKWRELRYEFLVGIGMREYIVHLHRFASLYPTQEDRATLCMRMIAKRVEIGHPNLPHYAYPEAVKLVMSGGAR